MSKPEWQTLLQRLSGIGVLTGLGGGMYGLHPALPSYLTAEWRRLAGGDFAAERAAAEQALLRTYAAFGDWLLRQITSGAAEVAFGLLARQRRTMGRLLGAALTSQRYGEAQSLLQPLNEFWKVRGLRQEARGWLDRCLAVVEDRQGTPPDLASEAGALWLFVTNSDATWAIQAGELDAAYHGIEAIRQRLDASPEGEAKKWRLATAYHQLGIVVQNKGDLAAAEGWYRKALEIKEALSDRAGLALSYHQLGRMTQDKGDRAAAEGWFRKSLEIKEALSDRAGLAMTYHQLGIVAQDNGDRAAAEGWYRKALEIEEALSDRAGLAMTYHQLGIMAQDKGDLAAAEGWYRKALEIKEALGDRPSLASTYGQLGLLAEARKDPGAALDWTVRCVALFPEFPHPATGPGPTHLARLTTSLGVVALEASWQCCTGEALPKHIRTFVTNWPGETKS